LDQPYPLQAAEDSCLFSAILQAATKNIKHVIIIPLWKQAIQ